MKILWTYYFSFQNLIYGLFISEINDQNFPLDFLFVLEFKLGLKKKNKDQVHGEGVQICIEGVQKKNFKKYYIYKNFRSGGSNEPLTITYRCPVLHTLHPTNYF